MAVGWGQVSVPKQWLLRELMNESSLSIFVSTVSRSCLPRRPSRPSGESGPDPSGVAALAWVPVCVKPCVCSPRVESLFSRFLWTQAPLTIKVKCSGDLSSQCLTPPQIVQPDVELRAVTPRGESLGFNYFPAQGGSPMWKVWDLIVPWKYPNFLAIEYSGFYLAFGHWVSFLVGWSLFSRWLFRSWLWFWCFHERRWTQVLLLYHLVWMISFSKARTPVPRDDGHPWFPLFLLFALPPLAGASLWGEGPDPRWYPHWGPLDPITTESAWSQAAAEPPALIFSIVFLLSTLLTPFDCYLLPSVDFGLCLLFFSTWG